MTASMRLGDVSSKLRDALNVKYLKGFPDYGLIATPRPDHYVLELRSRRNNGLDMPVAQVRDGSGEVIVDWMACRGVSTGRVRVSYQWSNNWVDKVVSLVGPALVAALVEVLMADLALDVGRMRTDPSYRGPLAYRADDFLFQLGDAGVEAYAGIDKLPSVFVGARVFRPVPFTAEVAARIIVSHQGQEGHLGVFE